MTRELVLADSLYGESKVNFVNVLDELKLPYILAIRSNHALWLPQDQEVVQQPWQTFERSFSNGTTEIRYMAEVISGKRRHQQYWLLTTDPKTLPDNSTTFVMVAAPAIKLSEIGDSYGLRTSIEYGLKQAKDTLGWADFRMTHYEQIEKWWEMVMSAFLMVSLFADAFNNSCPITHQQFAGASVVEQSKWLETSAQQFTFNHSTVDLFQLVKAMVRSISYCFITVWI